MKPPKTLTLVVLLLCSVSLAPVMAGAGTHVIEDGVHLVKFDDSPTKLDPCFYIMDVQEDFVVDGDQYYWVRIGSVVAKGLTTVWWAKPLAATVSILIFIAAAYCWYLIYRKYFPKYYAVLTSPRGSVSKQQTFKPIMVFFVPFFCILGLTVTNSSVIMALSDTISGTTCDNYADLKASDGTILLKVDKIHPETNTLFMKSGVNLTNLTHLSSSGMGLPGTANPI